MASLEPVFQEVRIACVGACGAVGAGTAEQRPVKVPPDGRVVMRDVLHQPDGWGVRVQDIGAGPRVTSYCGACSGKLSAGTHKIGPGGAVVAKENS